MRILIHGDRAERWGEKMKMRLALIASLILAGCGAKEKTVAIDYDPREVVTLVEGDVVIQKDAGGSIFDYGREIARIRRVHPNMIVRVVDGGMCASSCTMFLALPNFCVEPMALLAFHGPSSLYGRELPPDVFEWSINTLARHYPGGLREWYLAVGVHAKGEDLFSFSGAELIKKGWANACRPRSPR